VALGLALAKRPRLLLLDEPIASLDPLARREFLQALMGAVGDGDTTVLLSSHLLADLERTCDHLIVLQAGQVQLSGAVDDLLASHRTLVGPRTERTDIPGVAAVVKASHTDRQSTLLARVEADRLDPSWQPHDVNLEDLVLAYLASTETRFSRSEPEVTAR
jgi:ABC-2 type transport system ATP-binding protein